MFKQRSAKAVKNVLLSALTVAVCATTVNVASAQQTPTAPSGPAKIGLIDMAKVFQDYQKFKDLRESLKTEIERSDATAKQLAKKVTDLQAQMKGLKADSPKYAQMEKALLGAKGDFDAFRAGEQRDLMRKESQIYKQVYVEVTKAVAAYASYKKYTLVIRFSPKGAEEADSPQGIVDSMNRQVVYHRPDDDITGAVLNYLNRKYGQKAQASRGGPAPR
ncbi:MAG: OmpH family outer membrane protein [Planctomycetaceae bacterium]